MQSEYYEHYKAVLFHEKLIVILFVHDIGLTSARYEHNGTQWEILSILRRDSYDVYVTELSSTYSTFFKVALYCCPSRSNKCLTYIVFYFLCKRRAGKRLMWIHEVAAKTSYSAKNSNKEIGGTQPTPMSDVFWDTVMQKEEIAQEYEMELGSNQAGSSCAFCSFVSRSSCDVFICPS